MREYKNLHIWKMADELVVEIYKLRSQFPKEEQYGIVSQITRAAVSVPTNIAEGSGRDSNKDFLRFLYIAMGSLKETQYLIHLSNRLGFIEKDNGQQIEDDIDKLAKTLFRFIQGVKTNI